MRWHGNERGKNQGNENLKGIIPRIIDCDKWEKTREVEYLIYVGSMITNDARCTRETKSRIAMGISSIQQEVDSFLQ